MTEAIQSERELALITVAPAAPVTDALPSRRTVKQPGHASEEQLRAMAERAPEPARDLYTVANDWEPCMCARCLPRGAA